MLVKIVGISTVALSFLYGYRVLALKDKERLKRTDGFLRICRLIRSEIDGYLTPVDKILEKCGKELLCDCGWTNNEPPKRLEDMSVLLSGEPESTIFAGFASRLGRVYREEAVKLCDNCISELSDIRCELSSELPRRRRSMTVLGASAAAIGIIIII